LFEKPVPEIGGHHTVKALGRDIAV